MAIDPIWGMIVDEATARIGQRDNSKDDEVTFQNLYIGSAGSIGAFGGVYSH